MDSLNCLSKECVNLLHRNRLLQPLIKSEFRHLTLSTVQIDQKKEDIAIKELKSKLKITNDDEFEKFLSSNRLDLEAFNDLALEKLRLDKYLSNQYASKSEARFLKRKNQLDIVIYSLVRVSTWSLCRELYFKIVEKESDFGEIASKYSEGIEKQTRGIIGPMSLEKAHPSLAESLRASKIGEVNQPITINNSHLITRVESYEPARLDNFMKDKMSEELFEEWLNSKSISILTELISQSKSTNK